MKEYVPIPDITIMCKSDAEKIFKFHKNLNRCIETLKRTIENYDKGFTFDDLGTRGYIVEELEDITGMSYEKIKLIK